MTAERALERACQSLVLVATAWYGLALGWGLFAQAGSGWDEFVSQRAIAADNMLAWGIAAPVREYLFAPPDASLYYVHHPFGTWWLITAARSVLGSHAYVPRLVPTLMSTATVPMLYGIGRRLWGPVPGAVTAVTYVVLPITLAFGNMAGLEPGLVFATTLTAWGYLRFTEDWRRRWLVVGLLGVLLGGNSDWDYYVFLAVFWSTVVLAAFVLPSRIFGETPRREVVRWALPAAAIALLCLGFYALFLQHLHAFGDLRAAEALRSQASGAPLREVLESRAYWIEASFTSSVIFLGKAAVPVLAIRVWRRRRALEALPLAILVMALVEYLKFEEGAEIHIYWSYPFAPYAALALGALAASALELAQWQASRKNWKRPGRLPWFALAGSLLLLLTIFPDGIDGLKYARHTAGSFNNGGAPFLDASPRLTAFEWMANRLAPRTRVLVHTGFLPKWPDEWALQRPWRKVTQLPSRGGRPEERYFVADLAFLSPADQLALARTFHLIVVDRYLLVDMEEGAAPADAYVLDEREPSALEWYFSNGTQPVRMVRADAWATWELRDAWGQQPNPPPAGEARTPEQCRIAHNIAVGRGDAEAAARLLEALPMDKAAARSLRREARLLGIEQITGVSPRLSLYVEATRSKLEHFRFGALREVAEPKAFTFVRPDEKRRVLGAPFEIDPALWRSGFIYVETFPLFQGPGRERYLAFESDGPMAPRKTPAPDGNGPLLELPPQ